MTFNPNLAKVKLHTKYQGRRSNKSAARVVTDGQTDRRYQVHYLSALLNYAANKAISHSGGGGIFAHSFITLNGFLLNKRALKTSEKDGDFCYGHAFVHQMVLN